MFNVIEVPLQAFVNGAYVGGWAAEAVDLCQAGDAGFYEVTVVIAGKKFGEVF